MISLKRQQSYVLLVLRRRVNQPDFRIRKFLPVLDCEEILLRMLQPSQRGVLAVLKHLWPPRVAQRRYFLRLLFHQQP